MAVEALVKLDRVTQKYFTGKKEFIAIRDVSLTVYDGEFVVLVGPSGCGKSTLLRIVTGLQKPSEGEVFYRGQLVVGVNPHATIVFQTFALFPWLTVQQNVEVVLKARGVPGPDRIHKTIELLDRVGLDGFETAYPRELSGGMRQKVGFARAMAVEPELLCLDEPFSALDVLSAESLRGELLELWLSGGIPTKAILMVTHNIEEAVFLADRIVVMEKDPGRIVADVVVDLPQPRQRKSPNFANLVDHVYSILAGQTRPEHIELGTAPGEPGHTRALPNIAIADLAGVLERLIEMPNHTADIFRLAEELRVDSDRLLRVTDAAELLGFATLSQGDITLTPLGEAFAEARINTRKEIFATRIRRLPLFQWLLRMLDAADKHQIERDVAIAALELEFPPREAKRQLDLIIEWGRYAELLEYDHVSGLIFLSASSVVAAQA
ncbi:MAG: AAA-associated domain-containing protein [Armatimonadetes bacterium]|nr:AAA-associated domain-containing protein [Armatimonadota bacterium]